MDNAMLMEIEKLRRVSLAALRQKYREVFGEETQCRHLGVSDRSRLLRFSHLQQHILILLPFGTLLE